MRLRRCRMTNFGGNVSFIPAHVYWPRTTDELLDCMRRHPGERMRCIGAGHSWSEILATDGVLFDLRFLKQIDVDARAQCVRVGAGCTLRRLLRHLRRSGRTLPTLGAITKQIDRRRDRDRDSRLRLAQPFALRRRSERREVRSGDRRASPENDPRRSPSWKPRAARWARSASWSRSCCRVDRLPDRGTHREDPDAATVLAGLKGDGPGTCSSSRSCPGAGRYLVYRRRRTTEHSCWLPARICRCANFWC